MAQVPDQEKCCSLAEEDTVFATEEMDKLQILQRNAFYRLLYRSMEKLASYRTGNMMLATVDRVLKVMEDTSKWSLPQRAYIVPYNVSVPLHRPLPWVFFLSLIVFLRLTRIWLSVFYIIIGKQILTPGYMVYYFQVLRRRLRFIRLRGLKMMRVNEFENSSNCPATSISKWRKQTNVFYKIDSYQQPPDCFMSKPVKEENVNDMADSPNKKRQRDDDSDDENLTISDMLDKYSFQTSDDSDYLPEDNKSDDSKEVESPTLSSSSFNSQDTDSIITPAEITPISVDNKETKYITIPKLFDADLVELYSHVEDNIAEILCEANLVSQKPTTTAIVTAPVQCPTSDSNETPANNSPGLIEKQSSCNSNPDHDVAAYQKPLKNSNEAVTAKEKKSYNSVSTQTATELLDWTVTIKTEITHRTNQMQLEKLDYSVKLTPASSAEDIFYSPMGSHQDLLKIIEIVPAIKSETGEEDLPDAPIKTAKVESGNDETSLAIASGNLEKIYSSNKHYYNAKNRNKNRR